MRGAFKHGAVVLCFLALIDAPAAMAQVDAKPGHFDNPLDRAPAEAAAKTELSPQIASQRGRLEALQAQLKVQADRVEELRQEAISAGIQGDGASVFIDAYRQEKKELDRLARALAPQIEAIKANMAVLQRREESVAAAYNGRESGLTSRKANAPGKRVSISEVRQLSP
jgi:hypothetical protein